MSPWIGMASLAGLSLFLARWLKRSSSLMLLVSAALAILWFTVFGCFDALLAGGWLWYTLCLSAIIAVVVLEKRNIVKLFSPGWVFFIVVGCFAIVVYALTQPMLTRWDEFTFWGTAAKVVTETNTLYTTAHSNLIARSYPPGLIVFSYMIQFFGPSFVEHELMLALTLLSLAAFSTVAAVAEKNKPLTLILLGCMLLLPFFFEPGTAAGSMAWSYLSCMPDPTMSAVFGGAICLYFGGGEKNERLLLPFGIVLAALTCIKDMGFALALLALFIAGADMIFCERKKVSFFGLRGWKALVCSLGSCVLLIVTAYAGWAAHLSSISVDRFNLGSQGESLSMVSMLLTGVKALFGIEHHGQFSQVFGLMVRALLDRPVSLLGPGLILFLLIILILACAWLFCTTKQYRRRVLVFAVFSFLGFIAFYLFNIFTYGLIFQEVEALVLKDYERYILPYWQGWLMGSLLLLAGAALSGKLIRLRIQLARAASIAFAFLIIGTVALRGNGQANVLHISPSLYGMRRSVQSVLDVAKTQGMSDKDVVYIVSQTDDGTRFYMFGYEMTADRSLVYAGPSEENGEILLGNVAVTLAPANYEGEALYPIPCTAEDLEAYLWQEGCTHVLLDEVDSYFLEEFSPLFADNLAGWRVDRTMRRGHRYYRVVWQDGQCHLLPERGGFLL